MVIGKGRGLIKKKTWKLRNKTRIVMEMDRELRRYKSESELQRKITMDKGKSKDGRKWKDEEWENNYGKGSKREREI